MIRFSSLVLVMVFLILQVSTNAATVQGRVTDIWDEVGIEGVRVTAFNESKQPVLAVDTKDDGTYSMTVPNGVFEIVFEKTQYQDRPTTVKNVVVGGPAATVVNAELLKEGANREYYRALARKALQDPNVARKLEFLLHRLTKADQTVLDAEVGRVMNTQLEEGQS